MTWQEFLDVKVHLWHVVLLFGIQLLMGLISLTAGYLLDPIKKKTPKKRIKL